MNILITGSAGFIGFHTSINLLRNHNNKIYGIDNLNNYYDVELKKDRLKILKSYKNFFFKKKDINSKSLKSFILKNKIKYIIHLAAQAGVRHSIKKPNDYLESNLKGFFNILEVSRLCKIKHLIFASTSSVYGDSSQFPLREHMSTNSPLSFYAATKMSNELMAHSYSNIYGLKITGVRFFTVYGTYGRPDMSIFKFLNNLKKNEPIKLFNYGNHSRDFTFVEDVADCLAKLLLNMNLNNKFNIYNISNSKPVSIKKIINLLKGYTKLQPKLSYLKMQQGDVKKTHGSNIKLLRVIGRIKFTPIEVGIKKFINWYDEYHK